MLKKEDRLTRKRDFDRLATQGRSVFGPYATLRVRSIKEGSPKIAFITSTKVMKKAVDRNRVKRRMRAVLRELLTAAPQKTHLLFILKPEIADVPYTGLVAEVRRLFEKVPEALTKPPKLSPSAKKQQEKRRASRPVQKK